MIKSIHIKNFLSHADSILEFSNRVNIISGISNDGKSAIRRAIYWVMSNRPLGDGLVRYYHKNGEKQVTKEATVKLVTNTKDSELTITRTKTKSSNGEYIIDNGSGKMKLESFGQQVPKEVTNALNLSDINLQSQFSPYFLAFDPPGQVATFLRSITKLDEIDTVCGLIAGKIRTTQQAIENTKTELCTINAQIGELERSGLDKLEELIKQADVVLRNNEKLREDASKLSDIICRIDDLAKQAITLPDDKILNWVFKTIGQVIDERSKLVERHRKLKSIVTGIQGIQVIELDPEAVSNVLSKKSELLEKRTNLADRSSGLSTIISKIRGTRTLNIDLSEIDGILKKKSELVEQYNKNVKRSDDLLDLIDKINRTGAAIVETDRKLEEEIKLRLEIESKLTICPISGKPCREINDVKTSKA